MDLKNIIANSLNQSYSAEEYQNILIDFAGKGKTSGEQKEDLIYYTKLNAQRSKRIGKTSVVDSGLAERIQALPKQTWLLITETWCGDAANSVPLIAKLAELNPSIDLRIVLRDENLELMDQFLTKGGRSIPKLIGLDEDLNALFDWGPRPKEAQDLYWSWREREDREPYKEFQVVLQKWYNENKSSAIQEELIGKIALEVS
ncbi:MAG: thioredoxin family protein [Ekhidna sp.]